MSNRQFHFLLVAVTAFSLLSGCTGKPDYKQTFELARDARASENSIEAKRLCKLALQQAESAGAGESDFYETTTSYFLQLPEVSNEDKQELLEHSVELAKKSKYSPRLESVLYSRYYALGDFYQAQKMHEQAAQALQHALDYAIKVKGADYSELFGIREHRGGIYSSITYPTSLYARLATEYEQLGKLAVAEPLRRKDLSVHEKFFGKFGDVHRDLDEGGINDELCALATNLTGQGKFDEAEKLFKRSIDVKERNRGKSLTPKIELSGKEYAGLAETYRKQGRFREAETCFQDAIKGLDKIPLPGQVGHTNPLFWQTKLNYAQLLRQTNRAAEAASIEEAVARSKAAEDNYWKKKGSPT
ncbi:MAG: tetratricopeptide repeat protein [Cyanobacteria bacterium]|nr:tetratricopeptide repeat protein [Cyanobacteriota bacterium]